MSGEKVETLDTLYSYLHYLSTNFSKNMLHGEPYYHEQEYRDDFINNFSKRFLKPENIHIIHEFINTFKLSIPINFFNLRKEFIINGQIVPILPVYPKAALPPWETDRSWPFNKDAVFEYEVTKSPKDDRYYLNILRKVDMWCEHYHIHLNTVLNEDELALYKASEHFPINKRDPWYYSNIIFMNLFAIENGILPDHKIARHYDLEDHKDDDPHNISADDIVDTGAALEGGGLKELEELRESYISLHTEIIMNTLGKARLGNSPIKYSSEDVDTKEFYKKYSSDKYFTAIEEYIYKYKLPIYIYYERLRTEFNINGRHVGQDNPLNYLGLLNEVADVCAEENIIVYDILNEDEQMLHALYNVLENYQGIQMDDPFTDVNAIIFMNLFSMHMVFASCDKRTNRKFCRRSKKCKWDMNTGICSDRPYNFNGDE